MDRRIQKSKQSIMDAFIHLMAEKEFEKITINEIAELANVNRGTVYLHYVDKYDLLDKCIETSLTKLAKYCSDAAISKDSSKEPLSKTFEYLQQHYSLYTTLLTTNGVSSFRNQLMKMMLENFDDKIEMTGINNGIPKDILAQFLASATAGLLEWWLTSSMPYSAKDMTEQLWKLLERNEVIPN